MTLPSENFLQINKKKVSRDLGFWSEETLESVHPESIRLWETGAYKRNLGNPKLQKTGTAKNLRIVQVRNGQDISNS